MPARSTVRAVTVCLPAWNVSVLLTAEPVVAADCQVVAESNLYSTEATSPVGGVKVNEPEMLAFASGVPDQVAAGKSPEEMALLAGLVVSTVK